MLEPLPLMTPLKRRRLELGLPQWALARRSGVPVSRISFAERGVGSLTRAEQRVLADALQADAERLFPAVMVQ
jgi:transcriptional regulator with XRE-family HTH domain